MDTAITINVTLCKAYSATREGMLADKLTWSREFVDSTLEGQQLNNLRALFIPERRKRLAVTAATGLTNHNKADARMLALLVGNAARTYKEIVDKRAAVTALLNTSHAD